MSTFSPRPESNSSHLAGEFFVAAELSKRGYCVALTMGNAKAIDIFAELDRRSVNIQVKAIRHKKNVGWPMFKNKVLSNVIYVFVCLNGIEDPPSYYIATPNEVRPRIKEYTIRGILNRGAVNTPQFLDRWDKIELALAAQPVSRKTR